MSSAKKGSKSLTLAKALPFILIIAGAIGLLASFVLTLDKIALLKDPTFEPSCNLNPVVACGSVIATDQASAFGFPNPLAGIFGFGAIITTGVALLAGATMKRWYWLAMWIGTIFGVGFVHWLFFQSVYRIGALCPYCIAVWIVTMVLFMYVTLYNLQEGHLKVSAKYQKIVTVVRRHHIDLLLIWALVICLLILKRFWYYWSTLL